MGSTESPYAGDFELDYDDIEADVATVTEYLKGLVEG
jgi:hypothetical protein